MFNRFRSLSAMPLLIALVFAPMGIAQDAANKKPPAMTLEELQTALALQEARVLSLEQLLQQQSELIERMREKLASEQEGRTPEPAAAAAGPLNSALSIAPAADKDSPPQTTGLEKIGLRTEDLERGLAGFRLSGDFRYRTDMQLRSSNDAAGPLQNIRSRYRLRLNLDKTVDPGFTFHMQLSTGPLNNGLTNDQDFAGTIAKNPFSIAEAYVDFHPKANIALRVGRMGEVFADGTHFLWDDDVRFNGFEQRCTLAVAPNKLGWESIEFRAGEYILTNPNVAVLSPGSLFVSAGFSPGENVRASHLFHPGVILRGRLTENWNHRFTVDAQIYRNPNQIQLASLPAGFPVLINGALGVALSGPMNGTGNATTTPGGAILTARDFHIPHIAYRLENGGLRLGRRQAPFWIDIQASRNTGASALQDAIMASVNFGSVRRFGDTRVLYQYAIKDANALISQFTDDDLGTGSGVNIAVHAVRFDLGLTRFLQWQNLIFFQEQRRPSNPSDQFFVPLGRGANTTLRYLGQLAFTF